MRILAIVHQDDAGPGVFAHAIAARGHELEVWQPVADNSPAPDPTLYGGVISLGGSMHPDHTDAHPWLADEKALLAEALARDVPVLGVCLGAELLASAAGGWTRRAARAEIGWYTVRTSPEAAGDPLGEILPARFAALEWHSYEFSPPPGAVALAESDTCLQAFRVGERAWGIQFHAEVLLETFASWLRDYQSDPDARGIDPASLLAQTRSAITDWNRLGHELCARFVQIGEAVSVGVGHRRTG